MSNFRTLSDPPLQKEFELPFEVDLDKEFSPPAEQETVASFAKQLAALPAPITENGVDYQITTKLGTAVLRRDIDFGKVGQAKRPSLFKAGAEKIAMQLGLLQHYKIDVAEEHFTGDLAYCFYRVRCDLDKIGPDGKTYTICTGYGSANTLEKRNGMNNVWNAANSTLKMATKRALVAAALSVSSSSGLFYQDMEDDEFINANISALSATNNPNAPITRKQQNLIYAKAGNLGMTAQQAKKAMVDAGYPSIKALTQKDMDAVLALFETPAEKETKEAMKGEAE